MAQYKYVGELYFEAEDMAAALHALGEHFHKSARAEVSHLCQEGSTSALGEPEFDENIRSLHLVDTSLVEVLSETKGRNPKSPLGQDDCG